MAADDIKRQEKLGGLEAHVLRVHVEAAGKGILLTLNTVMCDINECYCRQGQAHA